MSHLDEGVLHGVLDGEIPARDLAEIQKHLAECSECQARFAEAREFRDESLAMIERLDPAPVAAAIVTNIAKGTRRPRWRIPTAWAATIIGAVGIGYAIGGIQGRSAAPATIPMEVAAVPPPAPDISAAPVPATDVGPKPVVALAEKRSQPVATDRTGPRPGANEVIPVAGARLAAADSKVEEISATPLPSQPPRAKDGALAAAAEAQRDVRDEPAAAAPPAMAKQRSMSTEEADRGGAQSRASRQALLRADGPVIPNPADQRRRTISAVAAINALGGSIRLVDGLTPARFEQQGEVVRVVYRTPVGTVVLEQWRAGDLLAHELIAPREAPADSVRAWERRVR